MKLVQKTYSGREIILIVLLRAIKLAPGCEITAGLRVNVVCGNPIAIGECIQKGVIQRLGVVVRCEYVAQYICCWMCTQSASSKGVG